MWYKAEYRPFAKCHCNKKSFLMIPTVMYATGEQIHDYSVTTSFLYITCKLSWHRLFILFWTHSTQVNWNSFKYVIMLIKSSHFTTVVFHRLSFLPKFSKMSQLVSFLLLVNVRIKYFVFLVIFILTLNRMIVYHPRPSRANNKNNTIQRIIQGYNHSSWKISDTLSNAIHGD